MEAILEATARDTFGKNEALRTRREGRVPAVLYGGDGKSVTPIAVQPKALLKILHSESGQNTLISLKLAGGGDARVLVRDVATDPKWKPVTEGEAMLVHVIMPKAEEVAAPAEAVAAATATPAEPEVIKKGKKEEGEEEKKEEKKKEEKKK